MLPLGPAGQPSHGNHTKLNLLLGSTPKLLFIQSSRVQFSPKVSSPELHTALDFTSTTIYHATITITMSFLTRTTPILRTAVRSSTAYSSPRLFSVAAVHQKSATETVKDGLKKVDRAVSDVAVAGIDKGGMY